MNNTEGNEPRQFSCFDDHNNDGWGNSTLDEVPYIPDEENETEPEDQDYPNELSESISNRPVRVTEGFKKE